MGGESGAGSAVEEPSPGERRHAPRLGVAALVFVVVSLAALALVPVLVQHRVAGVRAEVDEVADPARALVTRIQLSLARELSALRGYLITGDPAFLQRYREAVVEQRRAYAALEPLVNRLGTGATGEFAELRTLAEQWHGRAEAVDLAARATPDSDVIPRSPASGSLFDEVLDAATELDEAIAAETRRRRDAVRVMEQVSLVVTGVLVALALASTLVIAHFARHVGRLARSARERRREAEGTLAQLRQSTEAKERLVRGVTHDVKNPLGAADGYAELLEMGLRGPLAAGQAELVAGVRRSIHSALAIIDDLLALSSAESGELPVHEIPIPLATVIREATDDHRGAAQVAGHALDVRVADDLPVVHTDPVRVQQVLGNLLSNAIKYTPSPGRILVSAAPADRGERPGRWVAVHVVDDGPGIPPAEREAIFLEFKRGSTARAHGHGLGLAISLRMARLLGGDLTLDSTPGAGSRFTLWLPAPGAGTATAVRAAAAARQPAG